jgi:hypothetical protein
MGIRRAVSAAGVLAVLVAGCASSGHAWNADQNSVYVARDGHVESALVYTSEQVNELYDSEELAAYIGQAVDEYNSEHGGAAAQAAQSDTPVSMKSCGIEGNTGTVTFAYASPEDFVTFSAETGDDTHTITAFAVSAVDEPKKDCTRIEVTGTGRICTEGKILETSDSGVTQEDDYTVVTDEGEHYIIFK